MENDKTPPKQAVTLYLVGAVVFTGLTVFFVMRGSGWGFFAGGTFLFIYMAWLAWYQRRKVAKSQEP